MEIIFTKNIDGRKPFEEKRSTGSSANDFKTILIDTIEKDMGPQKKAVNETEAKEKAFHNIEYLLDLLDNYGQCLGKEGLKKEELRPYLYQMGEISQQLQEIIASHSLPEAVKEIAKETMLLFRKEETRFLTGIYG